ncbi:MAG TPA: acyl-CoA reductase [Chitinophagaceae bacterium]|nr:acyl-CoA reductase [Chitinophagaceae bacterium]
MNLQYRIDLMSRLGQYILINPDTWQTAKDRAYNTNGWFVPEFVEPATENIATHFLNKDILEKWAASYDIPDTTTPKTVGIVMAGNIPLVGFHDLLCVFISGHKALIKTSSKDEVLIKHLAEQLIQWEPAVAELIVFSEMLKGCDAYIATGSNNTAGYFDYYFNRFPNIIRRNRTSVAILSGKETNEELQQLADDVYLYFGLGCRNVTKIYVPNEYDFVPLLDAFRKYEHLADHHKYKNNYDYNLALHLLNKKFYMSNPSILLAEEKSVFSPISQLNYEFYSDAAQLADELKNNNDLQCIVGNGFIPFGKGQSPSISDYADGVDTMSFLRTL